MIVCLGVSGRPWRRRDRSDPALSAWVLSLSYWSDSGNVPSGSSSTLTRLPGTVGFAAAEGGATRGESEWRDRAGRARAARDGRGRGRRRWRPPRVAASRLPGRARRPRRPSARGPAERGRGRRFLVSRAGGGGRDRPMSRAGRRRGQRGGPGRLALREPRWTAGEGVVRRPLFSRATRREQGGGRLDFRRRARAPPPGALTARTAGTIGTRRRTRRRRERRGWGAPPESTKEWSRVGALLVASGGGVDRPRGRRRAAAGTRPRRGARSGERGGGRHRLVASIGAGSSVVPCDLTQATTTRSRPTAPPPAPRPACRWGRARSRLVLVLDGGGYREGVIATRGLVQRVGRDAGAVPRER